MTEARSPMSDTNSAAANQYTIDQDFYDLLAEFTVSHILPDEVLQALKHAGVTRFEHFAFLDPEDVEEFTKPKDDGSHQRVPLSAYYSRKLVSLSLMIYRKKVNGDDDYEDISVYTYNTSSAGNHFTIDQDLYDLLADVTHSSHLNNQILQVL